MFDTMHLHFNVPFAIVSVLVGCIFGTALRYARQKRVHTVLLLAAIATFEFGLLVTGTRRVEWLMFIGSAISLLLTASIPTPKVVFRVSLWIALAMAIYYIAACLIELTSSRTVSIVNFVVGSILSPLLMLGLFLVAYALLRFVLERKGLQPLLNRIHPFQSSRSFGLAVALALSLFYIIPWIAAGLRGGLGVLTAIHYTVCLWVLAKSLIRTNRRMFAFSVAAFLLVPLPPTTETLDPASNPGRLVGMVVIGYCLRSIGIQSWPRRTPASLFWMACWSLAMGFTPEFELKAGSDFYPGGFYYANWIFLVSSISALALGFGIPPFVKAEASVTTDVPASPVLG